MKLSQFRHAIILAAFILTLNFAAVAQNGKKGAIDETNVRAELGFLASDALQGRGSGTGYERIAAEYIGSQFMQFGLEPAGEAGWDGKLSFVQTVNTNRRRIEGSPVLKFGSTTLEHGKQILVSRVTGEKISGALQKLNSTDKPAAGAAVFVKFATAPQNINQAVQPFIAAGAAIVIVEETPQIRTGWANTAARQLNMIAPTPPAKPSVVIIVDSASAAVIAALADGTNIEFSGTPGPLGQTWNAIGKLTGSDSTLASEVILLSSHLDHLGATGTGEDKIFNGADDDASGSVAVLEMARILSEGKRPKRTVYFVCFGSEEIGGAGANYFVNNLPFPKDKFVANLEFEMIGRPDDKVKAEELWLTGYELSNLGPELAKRGAKLVQDPHPEKNFFQRSDNYTLARQGIVAHTVSSYGLHTEYHTVKDELKTINFTHMTQAINSMVEPVKWLVNSDFKPTWNEGKKP